MYQTMKVFSINYVFQNPVTEKHASLFIHNTTAVIVIGETTIITKDNHASKILCQMGFTNRVHDGHGDVQELDI
ncbi:hypothetical protein [Paenibacillus glucanolyticus]|uniref:hypothetical protein n=1 Tax=Paenibacillus glucanolyticus TaxID=59843 RepID=UPI00096F0D00|nr:hypothetical protein [Paenibacillus glucanolyticus]OMF76810.1 hypothetical protein BK142_14930 [Paenibacillus glucanolyticus]